MTLAEGLELKELREALEYADGGGDEWCPDCTISRPKDEGHKPGCRIGNALSRDKTSYEREALLVENVVEMARTASSQITVDDKGGIGIVGKFKQFALMKFAVETLDVFRGERTYT